MGGNALKSGSVRLPAQRYREIETEVLERLRREFPAKKMEAVAYIANKVDFGDLDILIQGGEGYDPAKAAASLGSVETVFNGDVTSLGYPLEEGTFQVDLIKTPIDSFEFASRYFGFNDFGNLVGRVAHKFGAKFGHLGLLYPMRDPDSNSHMIAELEITADFSEALALLGYDPYLYAEMRSNNGFRTLEDVFNYVVMSPYVNRDIYLLENRSHIARTRDAKRPTYNAFLKWLEEKTEGSIPAFPWAPGGSPERTGQKQAFLDMAMAKFPAFRESHTHALANLAKKKLVRKRFNGDRAALVTGASGKNLGRIMSQVRESFADDESFDQFFMSASESAVDEKFRQFL